MTLIDALRLEKFRGFSHAEIEIKPLTVFLGPNSAGKSSFGQSLAALAHAHWRHGGGGLQATLTPDQRELQEWPVDLGSFDQLRMTGSEGAVGIGLQIAGEWIRLGFGGVQGLSDLRPSYVDHPLFGDETRLETAKAPREGAISRIDVPSLIPLTPLAANHRIRFKRINEVQWVDDNGNELALSFDGVIPKAGRHIPGGTSVPFDVAASGLLANLLTSLSYLRGARERPRRAYPDGRAPRQAIGYAGEYTAGVLAEMAKENVINWREESECVEPLESALSYWLSHLGLAATVDAQRIPNSHDLRVRVQLREGSLPRDLPDLGFGISQILPVLVSGLLQAPESLFVVDLPEAHLHPKPQAALADFFCALALTDRWSLVETHSDLFFHQLRLRVAQQPKLADAIRVYFIDQPETGHACAYPRRIDLDAQGQLEWPKGFMHEGWELENSILRARHQAP